MMSPVAPRLNRRSFRAQLVRAITAALGRAAARFEDVTVDSLAIDVHPWSGFLNLSMRTTDDAQPRMRDERVLVADWTHSSFAVAHEADPRRAWPEAASLATAMREAHEADETVTELVYELCADAARDPRVWRALDRLYLGRGFCIAIPDVDQPSRTRFVWKAAVKSRGTARRAGSTGQAAGRSRGSRRR